MSPANDKSFSFTVPDETAPASVNASTSYDLVVVATVGGQRETSAKSSADQYNYKGPSITSVSVAGMTMVANSGVPIVVRGDYFQGVTQVVLKTFTGGAVNVTPSSVSSNSVSFSLPDLKKALKALGVKSAKYNVILEIPVNGTSLSFVDSISSASNEFNVKSRVPAPLSV